jgi:hypothetical protein
MRPIKPITIVCLLSFSPVAFAQPAPISTVDGSDVVTLRDGTILRGHVTELKPGDHVELVLLDGRTQTIQWSEIAASAGPSFPVSKPNPAARFLAPAPDRVPVQIASTGKPLTIGVLQTRPAIGQESATFDDGVNVSQLTTNYQSSRGVVVCTTTPCQIYAHPGLLKLQPSGEDVLSYSSELSVPNDGVRVTLRAPSVRNAALTRNLLILSLPGVIAGATLLGMAPAYADKVFPAATSPALYGTGAVALSAGVGLGIAGLVTLLRNRSGIDSVEPLTGTIHF